MWLQRFNKDFIAARRHDHDVSFGVAKEVLGFPRAHSAIHWSHWIVCFRFKGRHNSFIHFKLLLWEYRDWWLCHLLSGTDLTIGEFTQAAIAQSHADLRSLIFHQTFILVHLVWLLHSSVHLEVLVVHDYFPFKIVYLFLLQVSHFLHHVIARNEDCLEIVGVWESLLILDFAVEIRFTVVSWIIWLTLKEVPSLSLLLHVWDLQIIHSGRRRFLWMLIPGSLLSMDIKTGLGLPARLIVSFLFLSDQVLIDEREWLGQVFLRIRVKVRSVVLN